MMNTRFMISRMAVLAVATGIAACSNDSASTAPPAVAQPANIQIIRGVSEVATVNNATPDSVVARIVDASGNPVAGVAVSFAVNATSGSISSATVQSDSNGLAAVSWTLGKLAGIDSLTVSAGQLTAVASATALPDVPATMTILSGNDQSGTAGTELSSPLVVLVKDQWGNVVPNAVIQWSADNGSLTSSITVTDQNGMAQNFATLGSGGADDVTAAIQLPSGAVSTSFTEMGS